MNKLIISIFTVSIVAFSCKKEKAEEPETPAAPPASFLFAADVQPIFAASCGTGSACHGTTGNSDNKIYETHSGASAVSGATTKGAINHSSGFKAMPQGGSKLSATKIAVIEAWIDAGMKND